MDECKNCHGHGYYYIHADAAETANDKKKVCTACWGTGLQTDTREQEKRARTIAERHTVPNTWSCDDLTDRIRAALASAESDLLKRMIEPSLPSEAMRLAANRVWSGGRSEWWPLKIETVSEAWPAMLRAFAKENNIDLEVELVDG